MHPPYLPRGYRFNPTDEELIVHYLRNKVSEEPLPTDAVIDGDPYGDIEQLLNNLGDEVLYWFVKNKKNTNGTKTNRRTANGRSWQVKVSGNNKKQIKDKSGNNIGTVISLIFDGESNFGKKKHLNMDEYKLDGPWAILNSEEEEWVLCRIKQSKRTRETGSTSALEGIDDDWEQHDHSNLYNDCLDFLYD